MVTTLPSWLATTIDYLLIIPELILYALAHVFWLVNSVSRRLHVADTLEKFQTFLGVVFSRIVALPYQAQTWYAGGGYNLNSVLDINFALPPDPKVAELMVQAAKLGYEDERRVKHEIIQWSTTSTKPYEYVDVPHTSPNLPDVETAHLRGGRAVEFDTQFFLLKRGDDCILSFRGTEGLSLVDWSTDFLVHLTGDLLKNVPMGSTLKLGRLHYGFQAALGLVEQRRKSDTRTPILFEALRAKMSDAKHVYITGHSLGAALALVFGAIYASLRKEEGSNQKVSIYTFGCPRVGDADFASAFDDLITTSNGRYEHRRYVNNNDIVPRVPVAHHFPYRGLRQISGFRHPETGFVWMDCKGNHHDSSMVNPELPKIVWLTPFFTLMPPTGKEEWVRTLLRPLSMFVSLFTFGYGNFITDHLPGDYAQHIIRKDANALAHRAS